MATTVQIVPGYSLKNRLLLYLSALLAPAQLASGVKNNCPSNLGFLAYNLYTQVQWYRAIQGKQLHALSLLTPTFNFFFAVTYLGGITSGNVFGAVFLGLGTAAAMTLNTVSGWTSWATNQPQGFGVYQFFFFGWRTLSPGWHKFILLWQIGDSGLTIWWMIVGCIISVKVLILDEKELPWWSRPSLKYIMIPLGGAVMSLVIWLDILWTELIVARNHIDSDTDWTAVWLFVAQVAALLLPSHDTFLGCLRGRKKGHVIRSVENVYQLSNRST